MSTAVVIGAGMAGLLAARALAERFDRVVVVERDRLTDEPVFRPGVPQGRHAHALLLRGSQVMEDLFPGLWGEVIAAGARMIDSGETHLLTRHGWAARGPIGLAMLSLSRPLLETTVRRRLDARIIDATIVVGLRLTGSTVDGVVVRQRDGDERVIEADLVVNAAGSTSKLPDWLGSAGYGRPSEVSVDSRTGYATRLYALPHQRDVVLGQLLNAPDATRGCSVTRIEGGRLMVTLQGAAGDHPPNDEAGFDAFVRSLRAPLAEMIAELEPLTPIYRYARTASSKRAYERLAEWPAGLIVIGDAVCTLNPVYGQGMTVAALETDLLRRHDDFSASGCRRFQAELADVIAGPWRLSSTGDLRWQPDFVPSLPARVLGKVLSRWQVALTQDLDMVRRFLSVMHMQASPASLLSPPALWKLRRAKAGPVDAQKAGSVSHA